VVSLLNGCSSGDPSTYEAVVGKPYYLKEWPDSAYLANLDSIAAAEPVTAKEKAPTEVSVNPMMSPLKPIPGIKPVVQNPVGQDVTVNAKNQTHSEEDFAERFQKSMDKLQADPDNAKLFQEVTVRDGEDLLAVLHRVYGKEAYRLPAFVAKSQLESLNGFRAQDLKPGQTFKIPKL